MLPFDQNSDRIIQQMGADVRVMNSVFLFQEHKFKNNKYVYCTGPTNFRLKQLIQHSIMDSRAVIFMVVLAAEGDLYG